MPGGISFIFGGSIQYDIAQNLLTFGFWGIKGQGHAMTFYGQISLFSLLFPFYMDGFHCKFIEASSIA